MNRIFGFFKDKISEVKQQNKQELQALANALTQSEYSTDRVITMLQSMKSNFMNWNILIANEASTGLYYSQLHNRNICLRKIKGNKELKKQLEKNKLKLAHIKDTASELSQITELNGKWMNQVNKEIEGINKYLAHVQRINQAKREALNSVIRKEEEIKDDVKQQNMRQGGQKQEKEIGSETKNEVVENKNVKIEEIVDDQN